MALGDSYVSLPQLKSHLKISDTVDDTELAMALSSATRGIEDFCNRQFNDAGTVSARVYQPENYQWVVVVDYRMNEPGKPLLFRVHSIDVDPLIPSQCDEGLFSRLVHLPVILQLKYFIIFMEELKGTEYAN